MQLFQFAKVKDTEFATALIGEQEVGNVLSKSLYRFVFTLNPLSYIRPVLKIISHPIQSYRIYKVCLQRGVHRKKAFGQLLYGYQLIGQQFDLVYINALQTGRHISVSAFFPNSKILASSRGQDFDWNPTGYDGVLAQIDHLHVLGTHLQQRAIERKFPKEKTTIIPPARLPFGNGKSFKVHQDKDLIQIVTAARLIWTKGYVYSLRAIALLKEKLGTTYPIRYTILGKGEDLALLEFEIRRLGLEDTVVLKGWVGQAEVNQILCASHIYMLLSIEEGFNNSVMQAQSLGIPCVVSDAGGLPDNVVDGITGFVVPRYDASAAAEKLAHLIQDESLRNGLGKSAIKRMEEQFNLEKQVQAYSKLFQSLLNASL